MEKLPNEIVYQICDHIRATGLYKPSLKSLRLSCKQLSLTITPLLFETVYVESCEKHLKGLVHIAGASRLRFLVRRIEFWPNHLKEISRDSFMRHHRARSVWRSMLPSDPEDDYKAHLEYINQRDRLRMECYEWEAFKFAFGRLVRLREVLIHNSSPDENLQRCSPIAWGVECSWDNKANIQSSNTVLSALAGSDHRGTSLSLQGFEAEFLSSKNILPSFLTKICGHLRILDISTKLALSDTGPSGVSVHPKYLERLLSHLLLSARHLEQLVLNVPRSNYVRFDMCWDRISSADILPKLKSLELGYFSFSGTELRNFCEARNGKLTRLALHSPVLLNDTWPKLWRWMKTKLRLHTISFSGTMLECQPHLLDDYCGTADIGRGFEFESCAASINRFFRSGGPLPDLRGIYRRSFYGQLRFIIKFDPRAVAEEDVHESAVPGDSEDSTDSDFSEEDEETLHMIYEETMAYEDEAGNLNHEGVPYDHHIGDTHLSASPRDDAIDLTVQDPTPQAQAQAQADTTPGGWIGAPIEIASDSETDDEYAVSGYNIEELADL